MSDLAQFVLLWLVTVVLVIAGVTGAVVGLSIANAHWNCSSWSARTGETTQVIAGECYVRNGPRWELFDTYIKHHHVDVEGGE